MPCNRSVSIAPHFMRGVWGLILLLALNGATAVQPRDALLLLRRADDIKTANHSQFIGIVNSLKDRSTQLSASEREFLNYLVGWESVYEADYDNAISQLQAVIREASEAT